jgi:hypothetical protein
MMRSKNHQIGDLVEYTRLLVRGVAYSKREVPSQTFQTKHIYNIIFQHPVALVGHLIYYIHNTVF